MQHAGGAIINYFIDTPPDGVFLDEVGPHHQQTVGRRYGRREMPGVWMHDVDTSYNLREALGEPSRRDTQSFYEQVQSLETWLRLMPGSEVVERLANTAHALRLTGSATKIDMTKLGLV